MRKLILMVSFVCAFTFANSQNLTIEGTAPDLYVSHTVAPKENFYSVGRLYNQAPRVIASFNNITMEKGLTIGQHIKVPLTDQNFDVTGNAGAGETLIPITHIVVKSESLTKIGNDFKVTPQLVKQWNSLSSDNITPGAPLVVGHLKVKSSEQTTTAARRAPVNSQPPVAKNDGLTEVKQTNPELKNEVAEQTKPVSQPQKEIAVSAPVKTSVRDEVLTDKTKPSPGYQQQSTATGRIERSTMETGSLSAEGAFSGLFSNNPMQRSLKNKNGEAATFKSTSGWQDKKYYVLMDGVNPGTILKISAADKVVYAKVLGGMPEMKENNGLLLRISNSAASSLGIIDPKFPVEVSYYQ